jgi:orotidine-5'-phosphate decarboxylase
MPTKWKTMQRSELLARLRELPAQRRIITALDVPGSAQALELAGRLGDGGGFVKVGLELFSAAGPQVVRELQEQGRDVFLDLKYNDIPNTVASAARIAAELGASLCTMHAGCGRAAMTAAAQALAEAPVSPSGRRPALLAVTVLTSLDQDQLQEMRPCTDSVQESVERLAALAWDCGVDGLVCAAADLPSLRQRIGPEPLCVTPGIRPAGSGTDDQARITTPAMAVRDGADFLVIGRPITRADDPAAAISNIAAEMDAARQ